MQISKNFTLKELACPCGKCEPIVNKAFIEKLQKLRDGFGHPMTIHSWYRCASRNAEVKGSTNSKHLEGIAVDVGCLDSRLRSDLIQLAMAFNFKGIGVYSRWVHIDDRTGDSVLWVG